VTNKRVYIVLTGAGQWTCCCCLSTGWCLDPTGLPVVPASDSSVTDRWWSGLCVCEYSSSKTNRLLFPFQEFCTPHSNRLYTLVVAFLAAHCSSIAKFSYCHNMTCVVCLSVCRLVLQKCILLFVCCSETHTDTDTDPFIITESVRPNFIHLRFTFWLLLLTFIQLLLLFIRVLSSINKRIWINE